MTGNAWSAGAVVTVDGYRGVAWRVDGAETEPDEDTVWSGVENETGRVLVHMIGDDRTFSFDPDELAELEAGAYCVECGQTGCEWHTEED